MAELYPNNALYPNSGQVPGSADLAPGAGLRRFYPVLPGVIALNTTSVSKSGAGPFYLTQLQAAVVEETWVRAGILVEA